VATALGNPELTELPVSVIRTAPPAPPEATLIPKKVVGRQWVAMPTVRFPRIHRCGALADQDIHPIGHGPKMVGVHTAPIPALVVKNQALRNLAHVKLIRHAVSEIAAAGIATQD